MKKNLLMKLVVALLLLLGLYFLLQSEEDVAQKALTNRGLFGDLSGEKLTRIVVEKGSEKIEYLKIGNTWVLPAVDSYHVDAAKMRSLAIQIFELPLSQTVPAQNEQYAELGVGDESYKEGIGTRVQFFDAKDNLLGALLLGSERRSTENSPRPMGGAAVGAGQYVRRGDKGEVYLVASPVNISLKTEDWIDTNLLNISPDQVVSIKQNKITEGGEKLEFELERDPEQGPDVVPVFILKDKLSEGQKLKDGVLTQVRSGLENFRISGAKKAPSGKSEEENNLKFDFLSEYLLKTGIRYRVKSSGGEKQGDKFFIQIVASLDNEFIQETKKKLETEAVAAKTDEEKKEGEEAVKKPAIVQTFATAEEIENANKEFNRWIYEVPNYIGTKLRIVRTDLIEEAAMK